MRIGIDARFLTHPQPGGFKTYTENLISALAKLDSNNEYFLYLDRTPSTEDLIPTQSNFHTRVVSASLPMLGFLWREQVQLPRQAAKDKLDLFHAPCLTAPVYMKIPMIITVHDMIWAFPERFSQKGAFSFKRKFMEWYNYLVPAYATSRASTMITVSQAAKVTILEYLNFPPEKIHVTWEAARPSFVEIKDEDCFAMVRDKYGLPSKFILAIGSADPRKNMTTLVKAYSSLPHELREEYCLVIVWTHSLLADKLSEQIRDLGLEGKVQFLQHVSNEDLVLLYNAASLFAFPSLYEGFGLPLLEAMSCGTPVVAANNSSIPEIVGDAALLFEALDSEGISKTITYALSHEDVRSDLIDKGYTRNAMFSWENCARYTLSVYESVFRAQHGRH